MKRPGNDLQAQFEERLRFETLLTDLSTRFIGISSETLDVVIEDAQRLICQTLGLDRSSLIQFTGADSDAVFTHTWSFDAMKRAPLVSASQLFPWGLQQVLKGQCLRFASLYDMPAAAATDMETFRRYGTKSNVTFPLVVNGEVIGALGFATLTAEHHWPDDQFSRLRLVAEMFAGALARRRSDEALRESECLNRATFEQAAMGIAHIGIDTRWLRVNDKLCTIVGYSREELLQLTFQDITHPDDLETDLEYARKVLSGEIDSFSFEKRYIRNDRSCVWVNITVSLVRTHSGEPLYFIVMVDDINERKRTEAVAAEQLRFEALLTGLSARFVDTPADKVDSEIEAAQARVCACLDLEVSALWQNVAGSSGEYRLTHQHRPEGGPSTPELMNASEHFPWCLQQLLAGKLITVSSLETLPPEAARDKEVWRHYGIKTSLTLPLMSGGGMVIGFLSFNTMQTERHWPETVVQRLTLVGQIFANALARKRAEEELINSYVAIKQLKEQLQAENISLRQDLHLNHATPQIIGRSTALQQVLIAVQQVAATDSTVLLLGETGTGKELIASAIHNQSPRRDCPMVRVNCAAIPATLIESELFGREKGAYTGALTKQIGRFEAAHRSTIFLDEIGELPPEVQVKLLRVLQEKQIQRLGSSTPVSVDVRIIAATNCDLQKAIRDGRFRADLYYRLSVFPITIPALRERREDIPLMIRAFADHFARNMGKKITSIPKSNLDALQRYSWPGNVRELRNVVERAMILAHGPQLTIDVPACNTAPDSTQLTLEFVEREHIIAVLKQTGWRVKGKGGAAEILGMKGTTLQSRMLKLNIYRPT